MGGYTHNDKEMVFVTETLLDYWSREETHTIDVGRIALGKLVECKSEETIEDLRKIVCQSFELASKSRLVKTATPKGYRCSLSFTPGSLFKPETLQRMNSSA